jgi:hypothetical protein
MHAFDDEQFFEPMNVRRGGSGKPFNRRWLKAGRF